MTTRRDFDTAAADWDEKPQRVKLAHEISAAIISRLPLSAEWTAMDFGCGTGLVTLSLAPRLGSILGVDSSRKMVERLNVKTEQQGHGNVQAEHRDLEHGELPDGRFHLITSSMTMHHIPDVVSMLRSLRSLLHTGGRIALADLEAEDGSFHEDLTGVFHHGFSHERFTELLKEAGFTDITISTVSDVVKGSRRYPVFLAIAITS